MAIDQKLLDEVTAQEPVSFVQGQENSLSKLGEGGLVRTKRGNKLAGRENKTENVGNIFLENVAMGSKNVAGGIAATFGNTDFAAAMEASTQLNKDYDEKNIKTDGFVSFLGSLGDWTASSLGMAAPDIAGAIGAGVITGGLGAPAVLGSGAFSFVRMSGTNYRMMREWRPDADISQVRAASFILGGVQAAIEQLGGLEAAGAKKILGRKTINQVATDITKSAQRRGQLNAIQRTILTSKNRAASVAKGAIVEVVEEQLQAVSEIAVGSTWGEQEYTADDLFKKLIADPMRALPAGGLMGGVFHSAHANGSASQGIQQVKEQDKNSMFAVTDEDGGLTLDEEAMAADDAHFDALEKELKGSMGQGAKAAVEQIRSLAYALSFSAQVNYNKDIKPADFIKDLQVAFVESAPSQTDIAAIEAIREDGNLTQQEKGEKILAYVAETHSEDSTLYQTIKGVGQIVEASEIASATQDMIKSLEQYAPKLTDARAKQWRADVSERVAKRFGDETPTSLSFNDLGDLLTREDVSRLFIDEPLLSINGVEYVARIEEAGLSFTESGEFQAEYSDLLNEYLGLVEGVRESTTPTGGQELLATEKLTYAVVEGKYIIGQILAAFDQRTTAEQQQAIDDERLFRKNNRSIVRAQSQLQAKLNERGVTAEERVDIMAQLDRSADFLSDLEQRRRDFRAPKDAANEQAVIEASPDAEAEVRIETEKAKQDTTADQLVQENEVVAREIAEESDEAAGAVIVPETPTEEAAEGGSNAVAEYREAQEAEVAEKKAAKATTPEEVKVTKKFTQTAEQRRPDTPNFGWHGEVNGVAYQILKDGKLWYEHGAVKGQEDSIGKTKAEAINSLIAREQETVADEQGIDVEESPIPKGYELESTIVAKSGDATIREVTNAKGDVKFKVHGPGGRFLESFDTIEEAKESFWRTKVEDVDRKMVLRKKKSGERRITKKMVKQASFESAAQPLYEQLRDAKEKGDRIGMLQIMSQIDKLKDAEGLKASDASLPSDIGSALFELGPVSPSEQTVGEMTDDQVIAEGDKLGIIFSGFWADFRWATFVDPDGHSSFTVEDDVTIADALQAHRARQVKAKQEGPQQETLSAAGLFDSDPQTIRGMYLPTERTALFFKGAGVQTVIHEFVHHAKSVLPLEMQTALIETFNEQMGRDAMGWTVEADEWFANTMTKWIVNKDQPFNDNDKARAGAFLLARRTVMSAYADFDLSEETSAALDEMFGEIPDQEAVFGAKLAMDSMIGIDPPTADQVSGLFAGRDGSRFDHKDDTTTAPAEGDMEGSIRFDMANVDVQAQLIFTPEERSKASNKIHAILGNHETVRDLAREIFGDDFTSLTELTDNDMGVLLHIAEVNSVTNDTRISAEAEESGAQLLEQARAEGTEQTSNRTMTADSRGVRFFNTMKTQMRKAGKVGMMTISSMESMMKVLDNYSDTGVWHNLVSKPLNAARELRMTLTAQNMDHLAAMVRKRGINVRKVQHAKIDVDGVEYTKGEVSFMAIVNRMRPQDRDSFVMSNHAEDVQAGYALIERSDALAKADSDITAFIDVIHEGYKSIHGDLSSTYNEVTGKKMGEIDWYIPFVRANDWDDLDSVMSQLNHVTAQGQEFYKSSTNRMKERQGGEGGRINISDPFGQAVRYINQASTYIAMAPTVKQVSTLLATDNAKAAMKWKYGDNKEGINWKFVHGVMNDLVMGELFHDARIKPMSEGESLFRNWRTRYSMFALAGNVNTMVKQVLSAPLGIARSGAPIETTFRAFGSLLSIGPRAFGNALSNVANYATGGKQDYKHVLSGTDVYEQWSKFSQVLLNRHGNPETGEVQSYNFGGLMGIEISGIPLGESLMAGISAIDAVTVGTLWQATFDSWTRVNKANGMMEAEAIADAAEKANSMIRDTQPPSLPQDRNLLQRGNEYTRSFFMFTGATMRQYEVFQTDIMGRSLKALKAVKSGGVNELSTILFKGDNLQSGLAMQLGIGFILPAVMAGLISRRRKPTERELIADVLSYPFTAMPFMRGIMGSVAGIETNGGEASSYIERAGIEVYSGIEGACKGFYGDNWEGRNIQEAIDALSFLIHAPKVMGRAVSAGAISAIGEEDFLSTLKADYVDPYDEAIEF
jgi:hypothetical protein